MTATEIQRHLAAQPAHPLLQLPTLEQCQAVIEQQGEAGWTHVETLLAARRQSIADGEHDPLYHGWTLPSWDRADAQLKNPAVTELCAMGANRSSKTQYGAAKLWVTMLSGNPRMKVGDFPAKWDGGLLNPRKPPRVWCFHTTSKSSINIQQRYAANYMPPAMRNLKRTRITNLRWTQKNGFTDGTFILPGRAQCQFFNYDQNEDVLEGDEIDLAICDELIPLSWVETLRYRIMDRNGVILITFTPKHGYSPTVKEYDDGAEVIEEIAPDPDIITEEEVQAELQTTGKVPLVKHCRQSNARMVWFHNQENPFTSYENLKATVKGRGRSERLMRAYGVATRLVGVVFPRFNEAAHVTPDATYRKRLSKGATWYQVVDPCVGRNYFMLWVCVFPDEKVLVAREWPQEGDYIPGEGNLGPWAEPSTHEKRYDGDKGPAQNPMGWGFDRYAEELERIEVELGEEAGLGEGVRLEPAARIMDSRFGHTETMTAGDSSSLIDQWDEYQDIEFQPAAGAIKRPDQEFDEGVEIVRDWLDYNLDEPVGAQNSPKLYVHERCKATRFALKTWTGQDGKRGACKDPIDCLRYLALDDPEFLDSSAMLGTPGGVSGWAA